MSIKLVLVTCANAQQAKHIAKNLVTEGLAACVNIAAGIESVYTWESKLEESSEVLLLIKSSKSKLVQLERRISELHTYQVPEFIVIEPEHISPKYLSWLNQVLS